MTLCWLLEGMERCGVPVRAHATRKGVIFDAPCKFTVKGMVCLR